jgi:hypothetical protein
MTIQIYETRRTDERRLLGAEMCFMGQAEIITELRISPVIENTGEKIKSVETILIKS